MNCLDSFRQPEVLNSKENRDIMKVITGRLNNNLFRDISLDLNNIDVRSAINYDFTLLEI